MPSRWRLADPAGTRLREFDGEAVVFNPLTWQTHILNDSGRMALSALREAPRTADELVALLTAAAPDVADPSVVRDAVGRLLAELESTGLIQPAGE